MALEQFWLLFAVVASMSRALSSVLLKILRTKYVPDSFTMVVLQGLIGGFAVFLVPFSNIPSQPFSLITLGLAAGFLSMLVYLPFYAALSSEEVSRVSLVLQLSPLLVLLLAVSFLGEVLTGRVVLAFLLVLGGAILASVNRAGINLTVGRGLYLGIAAAFLSAAAIFLAKFVSSMGVFSLLLLIGLGNFSAGLFLVLLPYVRKRLRSAVPKISRAGWVVFFGEYLISVVFTGIFFVLAVVHGSVSIVSAIYSSHVVFVFVFALAFTFLAPKLIKENISKGAIIQKGVAVALVVAGILLLYL